MIPIVGWVSGREDFGKKNRLYRLAAHQFDKHTNIMEQILWFEMENKRPAWFKMVGKRAGGSESLTKIFAPAYPPDDFSSIFVIFIFFTIIIHQSEKIS
jgi:hypothetical protein